MQVSPAGNDIEYPSTDVSPVLQVRQERQAIARAKAVLAQIRRQNCCLNMPTITKVTFAVGAIGVLGGISAIVVGSFNSLISNVVFLSYASALIAVSVMSISQAYFSLSPSLR